MVVNTMLTRVEIYILSTGVRIQALVSLNVMITPWKQTLMGMAIIRNVWVTVMIVMLQFILEQQKSAMARTMIAMAQLMKV